MGSVLHIPRSALERRREIQLAADTAWPPTDSASAPFRRAFKLPVNKPIAK